MGNLNHGASDSDIYSRHIHANIRAKQQGPTAQPDRARVTRGGTKVESNIQQDPEFFSRISTERLEGLLLGFDAEVLTIKRQSVARQVIINELSRREDLEESIKENPDAQN